MSRLARIVRARRPVSAESLEDRKLLATLFVTSVDDSGPGTLRQAILEANQSPTPDVINFSIPGDDVYKTIRPLSPLPEIVSTVTIDGHTQPGALNSPVVELDGSAAGADAVGLNVSAPQTVIRALVINRFGGHGVVLNGPAAGRTTNAQGSRLEGNYIGTDVTGNVDLGNGGAGVVITASTVTIGSTSTVTTAALRNVISGNGGAGVWITSGGTQTTSGTTVVGNYIGTNAAGTRALGNSREGVLTDGTTTNTTIGGPLTTTPQGTVPRNVISGNGASGIRIAPGLTSTTTTVQGNFIGTDVFGANAVPNGQSPVQPYRDGITAGGGTPRIGGTSTSMSNLISGNMGNGVTVTGTNAFVQGNLIGTDATGHADLGNRGNGVLVTQAGGGTYSGNVVSGNGRDGVRVSTNTRNVTIGGNYIGTTAEGNAPLGNDDDGIEVVDPESETFIGGSQFFPVIAGQPQRLSPTAAGRNVISANGGNGILIGSRFGLQRTIPIQNNYIGTDATGAVPMGNHGSGIYLDNVAGVTIGGTSLTLGNVISANGVNGITIVANPTTDSPTQPSGNHVIVGNRIGVAASNNRIPTQPGDPGTDTGLGNAYHGIAIFNSSNNRIGAISGGVPSGAANVIAYNGGSGVLVQGNGLGNRAPGSTAQGNLISGNSIYGNRLLGIDLALTGEGITLNDMRDADVGPNALQNYPVIVDATTSPTGGAPVQVRYTLHSTPGRTFRIEFFASPSPDATGRGEGRSYIGSATASTDSGGNASGTFTATTLPTGSGLFITATATENTVNNTSEFSPAVRAMPQQQPPPPVVELPASVVGRHVFYDNSVFDAADPANPLPGMTGDDLAVAPDKSALLPGGHSSFANVTSYAKGINGVMVDIAGLPADVTLTPDEFQIRRTNREDATGRFVEGEKPYAVTVRRGAGENGSDRVSLFWHDYNIAYEFTLQPVPGNLAVANGWLEVTVLSNAVTGLPQKDVFYFGNLIAETGDIHDNAALMVNAIDLSGVRAHQLEQPVSITSAFDFNRDGAINALDVGLARYSQLRRLGPIPPSPIPEGSVPLADNGDDLRALLA